MFVTVDPHDLIDVKIAHMPLRFYGDPPAHIRLEQTIQKRCQFFLLQGFEQISHRFHFITVYGIIGRICEEYHRTVYASLPQAPGDLKPVHSFHADIQKYHIEGDIFLLHICQKCLAAIIFLNGEIFLSRLKKMC